MRIIFGIVLTAILSFGSFCAIDLYKDYNKGNKILNDYSYEELYKDFQIDDVTLGKDTVFYKIEDGKYAYTKVINKYIDFDGTANKYNLIINDRPCNITSSAYGTLYAKYNLNYYDIYGKEITNTPLELYYTFYQDKIEIRITATATDQGYSHLSNYLERRGLHLVLCEEVYNLDITEDLERVFVKYNINGNITTTSIAYGSSLLPPTPPTIEGKTFKGWSDGTGLVDLNTYKALKNTTLTAVYEANKYTVTFKNGDTVLSTQTVEYGNNATAPAVTPGTGYTFAGWDKSLKNITEDRVISATFNKIQYTIIFYDCDQRNTFTDLGSDVFVIGDTVTYPFEAPQGYTFAGWSLDMYGQTGDLPTSFTLDANRISQLFTNSLVGRGLVAYCTVNNYTLTFTDSYLEVRQGSSTGTALTTGCSLNYGTTVYLTATRTNYNPTIKVNGVTKTNNSTITITENTTITVDWTYVEPPVTYSYVTLSGSTSEYGDDPVTIEKPTNCVSWELVSIMINGTLDWTSNYNSSAVTETTTSLTFDGSMMSIGYSDSAVYTVRFKVKD